MRGGGGGWTTVCLTSKPPVITPAPKISIVAKITFHVFTTSPVQFGCLLLNGCRQNCVVEFLREIFQPPCTTGAEKAPRAQDERDRYTRHRCPPKACRPGGPF